MPEASLANIASLEGLSPSELEQRRRNIVAKYVGTGPGADPTTKAADMTTAELHELAAITSALRRRTAGPPKAGKAAKSAKAKRSPTAALTDLLNQI